MFHCPTNNFLLKCLVTLGVCETDAYYQFDFDRLLSQQDYFLEIFAELDSKSLQDCEFHCQLILIVIVNLYFVPDKQFVDCSLDTNFRLFSH